MTQQYNCVMGIPSFNEDGNLPPGIYWATWEEFAKRFGTNNHRLRLIQGLKRALDCLKSAGCHTVYVDGSFVSSKELPRDFDGCWVTDGVNAALIDPVLLWFSDGRRSQKAKYGGELFPALAVDGATRMVFLDFFQVDKETGLTKGIIAMDLRRLP